MNKKIMIPIVGAALLSGSLLGYNTTTQANSSNNVNSSVEQGAKSEQTLMQKAQAKVKELTGNTYTLIQGTTTKDSIHFNRENFNDIIAYKANGELEHISIKINYEDLKGGKYQTKLKETWDALFPGEEPKFVNISESAFYTGTFSSNAMQNKQIFMKENVHVYGVDYAPDDAPTSVQKKADEVFSKFTDGKVKQGAKLDRVYVSEGQPNVYQYKYKSKAVDVTFAIEEQTMEVLQAYVHHSDGTSVNNYEEFQAREKEKSATIKKLTLDTLMKNAMRDAKYMLNLDLKGYKGERGTNPWDEDSMTFTKEGAPSVTASFNKDGSFRSFVVDKYGQDMNFYGNTIVGPANEELKLLID
ncbi:hypothetical protein PAECIP112173_02748 [Paenibacillus sp. JJ-100]|uniref:hypothetical protein n=1 Tax=Paenibacillus sp. JJ-100 TaxID=2974896 RepID=UPI0022FF6198|nr:hypothetical protein [Paenibacillus sp. JJ-100]CAI6079928.1 hypothetical protein PAECIP112173_02748 [Paenibacillus sp. JJ-100]